MESNQSHTVETMVHLIAILYTMKFLLSFFTEQSKVFYVMLFIVSAWLC